MRICSPLRAAFCFAALAISTPVYSQDQLPAGSDVPYRSTVTFGNTKLSDDGSEPEGGGALGRHEYMLERYGGELTPESMAAVANAINNANKNTPVGSSWQSIGPTNANRFQNGVNVPAVDSGRARTILVDPANPRRVFFLTSGGGLWRTDDIKANKPTWVPLSDTVGNAGGSVAFGRTANTLYLGTGDFADFGAGGFIAKSTDGGATWGPNVVLTGASVITDIKVDTTEAQDIVLVGTNNGLFRSTDAGATFAKVVDSDLTNSIWSIQSTSAGWLLTAKSGTLTGNSQGRIVLSIDKGASWAPVNTGTAYVGAGRTTLASTGDNVVYALAANAAGSAQFDIFKSTDGGQNWSPLGVNSTKVPLNPNPYAPNMNTIGGQAWYNQSITVDPADTTRNTVYIGGIYSTAKSTDGGASWRILSSWIGLYGLPYVHADHHVSTVGPDGTVYFGHDGGISITFDGGKSFQNNVNEGLVTHLIYAMANGTKDTDNILIGLQDNGTRYRRSNSTVYNGSIGGDGFGVAWSQANNGISMGSYVFNDIRRFTQNPPNQQTKWERVITGIDRTFAYFVTPMTYPTATADPTGLIFFTNTQNNVYKTSNGGLLWVPIGRGEPGGNLPFAVNVRAVSHGVGVSPNSLNHIALAGPSGRVWKTVDGGVNWSLINVSTLLAGWAGFNSNVAYAANNTTLYLASDAQPSNGNFGRVAKTTDSGATWTFAATGLPTGMPVNKLLVDPRDPAGNTVYAATWIGVYKTTDGGASWVRYGSGMPMAEVSDLYLNPDGKFLRAATYGRGVWEIQP